jgi:hypothetical protein
LGGAQVVNFSMLAQKTERVAEFFGRLASSLLSDIRPRRVSQPVTATIREAGIENQPILPPDVEEFFTSHNPKNSSNSPIRSRPCPGRLFFCADFLRSSPLRRSRSPTPAAVRVVV